MDRRIKENLANCYRFTRSLVGFSSVVVNGINEVGDLNSSRIIVFDKVVCRPLGYVHLKVLESFFFELKF